MDYIKRAREFRAKKRLGQNFLVSEQVIGRIIDEAHLSKDETVLEIGAGLGFVTEELAKKAKKVIAVEIDPDAIRKLKSLPCENIEILDKDILKVDLSEHVDIPVKIIANIPYYITSPILVHLLGEIDQAEYKNRKYIKEIILMVQYEVAKRIVADQNSQSKEYGLLSILANFWAETELICKVPAGSFYPAPKVDSALIKIIIQETPAIDVKNPKLFRRIIQASFGMRRKTIKNALSKDFDPDIVIKALEKANITPNRRGETLSLEEYKNLTEVFEELLKL